MRQETNYCRIQWKAAPTDSPTPLPDTFQLDTQAPAASATAAGGATACALAYVNIPNGSNDGVTPLAGTMAFQNRYCGSNMGVDGTAVGMSIVCKSAAVGFTKSFNLI